MNFNLTKLFEIINKPERSVIGLMSGTSLDGLDIALCSIKGSGSGSQVTLLKFKTVPYTEKLKTDIKVFFAKRQADLQLVCLMNEQIAIVHSEMVLDSITKWGLEPADIDVIASHGQTIYHAPSSLHGLDGLPNATLQIGDGDHLAVKTGIITISDFRQKHLAAGGEGAPLAVYGDYLMFSRKGENRLMLNIGGIANFTYLPADTDPAKVFSTDLGPGNTMMDQFIQKHYKGLHYDVDGAIASSGTVSDKLLRALMNSDFLAQQFPKTTGPELFNLGYLEDAQIASDTVGLKNSDILATLCAFTAQVIIDGVKMCLDSMADPIVFMSGGGMHNSILVGHLRDGLPDITFHTTAELGVDPDAKEAVLFAVLANETLVGNPIDFGSRQGVPSVCMGKICLPQ